MGQLLIVKKKIFIIPKKQEYIEVIPDFLAGKISAEIFLYSFNGIFEGIDNEF